MPAATTFSHGLRSECTNLPELLQILSTVLQTILTTGKPSRYNNGRDSIAYAASCGYGGIGRRARFRFWWETVQVQVLLPAVEQEKSGRQDLNLFKLLLPAVEQETERRIRREVFGFYGRFRE